VKQTTVKIPKPEACSVQVSICTSETLNFAAFNSYHYLMKYSYQNTPHDYSLSTMYRTFIHTARKNCVKQAIKNDVKYLIFLDDDMVWPMNMLEQLVAKAEAMNLPMLSAYYTTRGRIPKPLIYYRDREKKSYSPWLLKKEMIGPVWNCDATGFGSLLIRTDVFKKVAEPWFEIPDAMTEDVYFFEKCYHLGIKCYVDTGLPCGHQGNFGTAFPYKTNIEALAVGNVIRADEVLAETDLISEKGLKNGRHNEQENEQKGRGGCERSIDSEKRESDSGERGPGAVRFRSNPNPGVEGAVRLV